MSTLLSYLLTIVMWAAPLSIFDAGPLSFQPAGVLPGLEGVFAGESPDLGIIEGHLSPCPSSPNCVVSQGADESHTIAPITYTSDRQAVRDVLVQVLGVVPRTEVIVQTEDYVRAKSTSRLMGFVDDLEFYLPADTPVIHLRSAARLGESDLGVNRRRLEQIRLALKDLGV